MTWVPYERKIMRSDRSGRVLASVTRVGNELHLDIPQILRLDEARKIGEALEAWGYPSGWSVDQVSDGAPSDGNNGAA